MTNILDSYKAHGYYVAKSLLKKRDVSYAYSAIQKRFYDQLKYLSLQPEHDDLFTMMQTLHKADIGRYTKVMGSLWRIFDIYELLHRSEILEFVRQSFNWKHITVPGGQVVLVMAEELRIPGGYFGFIPHQDFPSVQGSLDGIVIWVPLVDVDSENYPLEVISGSHKKGIYPSIKNSDSTWEVNPDSYNEAEFTPIEMKTGDVLIMSAFTIHRTSSRGRKGNLRLAVSTRFDNSEEPTFIDRCYPSAYIRSIYRKQFFEGFPTEDDIKGLFPK